MSTVVYEVEAAKPKDERWWYGMTVYRNDDDFTFRTHCRVYDGVRVESQFSSDPITLEATSTRDAVREAARRTNAMIRALHGDERRTE